MPVILVWKKGLFLSEAASNFFLICSLLNLQIWHKAHQNYYGFPILAESIILYIYLLIYRTFSQRLILQNLKFLKKRRSLASKANS